jgi:hypothetical protein
MLSFERQAPCCDSNNHSQSLTLWPGKRLSPAVSKQGARAGQSRVQHPAPAFGRPGTTFIICQACTRHTFAEAVPQTLYPGQNLHCLRPDSPT